MSDPTKDATTRATLVARLTDEVCVKAVRAAEAAKIREEGNGPHWQSVAAVHAMRAVLVDALAAQPEARTWQPDGLVKAARTLMREVRGFVAIGGQDLYQIAGKTNVSVLTHWADEIEKALPDPPASAPTEKE